MVCCPEHKQTGGSEAGYRDVMERAARYTHAESWQILQEWFRVYVLDWCWSLISELNFATGRRLSTTHSGGGERGIHGKTCSFPEILISVFCIIIGLQFGSVRDALVITNVRITTESLCVLAGEVKLNVLFLRF